MDSSYPVLTLPVEIVNEIFLHCVPSLPTPDGCSWTWASESLPPGTNEAPLLLSSICSAWRTIALSTPSLWTSLRMQFESAPPHSRRARDRASVCETWLSRSRDLPLHLSLRYTYPDPLPLHTLADDQEDEDPLLRVLGQFSPRWKTFRMSLQHYDFRRLCPQLQGRIPLLDTLCIDIVSGGRTQNAGWIGVFRDAPALHSLSVATPSWLLFLPKHLPVAQLTRLCAMRFFFAFFILSAAPDNMRECSIFLHQEPEREIFHSQPLHLPSLRSLRLLRGENHRFYLNCFTIPTLEILELTLGPADETSFIDFMTRSSCTPRTFNLVLRQEMTPDALLRCLTAVPSFTELAMDLRACERSRTDALISALAVEQVLPRLTSLCISCAQDVAYDGLTDMLVARANSSGLRDFTMEGYRCAVPDIADLQVLKKLVSSGMSIRLCVDGFRWV
ncbi:hypothetical protein FB451DRAFT_1302193 [Mycena latifolia]|nr:hypothetical protein FB451DRAFT_1302193 [Mycena latifolia]